MNLNIEPCSLKHRKQIFTIKQGRKDGLLLRIHCPNAAKQPCGKPDVRFTNVAFNKTGQFLVVTTCNGDVYNFNFTQGRFWYLTNTSSCTFLKFNLLDDGQIFIGRNDGVVNIINAESGRLLNALRGHKHPVKDASFGNKFLCATSSVNEAIVWDLRSCTKLQVLYISTTTVLKQVLFMPVSNNILTCFSDDSIQVWKYFTFDCIKQIQPALWNKFIIKCLTFTRNGRICVLGGYSNHLAVFLIDTWDLQKTIVLPSPITAVKKLDFISQPFDGGSNRILSILTSSGSIYFYDMQQDAILSNLAFNVEITRYDSSYDGRFVACITTDGKGYVYLLAPYVVTQDEGTNRAVKAEDKAKKRLNVLKRTTGALRATKVKIDDVLEMGKLLSILKEYGQYPEMHRLKIWIQLLQLPYNVQQYQVLNNKYIEAPFHDLEIKYPIENRALLKNLKKLLFGLSLWCPFFGEVAYLPLLVFPFVKVFQYDPLICFEAMVTILINWCQYWFEYYPLPPMNILAMVENVFLHQDPTLLQHLTLNQVTSKIYAWSLMQTLFSEVLSSRDWFVLWDHVLSNEPSFLVMVTVAFSLLHKQHLMAMSELECFKTFYHMQNLIDIKRLVSKAYQLLDSTEDIFHPRRYLENFRKLDGGEYPAFLDYPKAVVDYQRNAQALRSAKEVTDRQEKEILGKTTTECEIIKEAKRKIEEHLRMQEVDRIYKEKLKEDQESLNKQILRLNQLKTSFGSDRSSQSGTKLRLEECLQKQPPLKDNQLHQCKYLCYYREFLKTNCSVQAYVTKGDHKVSKPDTWNREIDKKLTEAITKAKAVTNSEQYLAQLAVTTGLVVLDKIIKRLKAQIQKCACENRSINQDFVSFMSGQIDLTEQRIEAVLKGLPANENIVGSEAHFNILKRELTQFKSICVCDESTRSTATV